MQTYATREIDSTPVHTPDPSPLRVFFKMEDPKPLRYSDIYGLDEIKAEFDKICYNLYNHNFTNNDGKYLISGPVYSGKHLLVKVFCAKLQAKCLVLELNSISQLHSDDTAKYCFIIYIFYVNRILKYMFVDCKNDLHNKIGVILINFDYNFQIPLSSSVYNTITNYIKSFKAIDNDVTMLFFGIASNYDLFNPELIKSSTKSFVTRYPDIFTLQKVISDYLSMIHNNLTIQERQQLISLLSGKSIPEIKSIFDHYAAIALNSVVTFVFITITILY